MAVRAEAELLDFRPGVTDKGATVLGASYVVGASEAAARPNRVSHYRHKPGGEPNEESVLGGRGPPMRLSEKKEG